MIKDYTYGTFVGLNKAGEEALAEVARRACKVIQTRRDRVVAAVEMELDNITLLSLNGIRVERSVAGRDADGLGSGNGSQSGNGEERLDGRHFAVAGLKFLVISCCSVYAGMQVLVTRMQELLIIIKSWACSCKNLVINGLS